MSGGDYTIETTLVINRCYGGFGLSKDAARELARRKGVELIDPDGRGEFLVLPGSYKTIDEDLPRNDPDLVAVVREMGERANGRSADLRVVTVPVEVSIERYDGREDVSVSGGGFTC